MTAKYLNSNWFTQRAFLVNFRTFVEGKITPNIPEDFPRTSKDSEKDFRKFPKTTRSLPEMIQSYPRNREGYWEGQQLNVFR